MLNTNLRLSCFFMAVNETSHIKFPEKSIKDYKSIYKLHIYILHIFTTVMPYYYYRTFIFLRLQSSLTAVSDSCSWLCSQMTHRSSEATQ